ncbi:MAG: hypothetical protein J7L17_04650 [Thaumarchaeota archaeon]|nr:hypothetical protein [Nitrososphaerota archaeon]
MMRRIDRELGLPSHVAQRIKARFKALEENSEKIKQRLSEIEGGRVGVRRISDENGDRLEFVPKDEAVAQLTSDGVLKPIEPNVLRIGAQESYLNDIVTANVTIASSAKSKRMIRELDPSMLSVKLPTPKIYERIEGRRGVEIGFIAEELPEFLRRGDGYDLKALVAILAWKITKIEEALSKLGIG